MLIKKLLKTGALSLSLFLSMGMTAFAATAVNIETKPTTVNVTVPSTMAVVFNEDGTNTLPTNFSVTNNSKIGGVSLTDISVNSGSTGWNFCSANTDMRTKAADTKDIKFTMGKEGTTKVVAPTTGEKATSASAKFNSGEISIPALGKETLTFSVERTAFKSAQSAAKAFDMTLTFAFN